MTETEQVALHPGHLVRGIEATDDPLFQGRMFSYLDTQLSRLGGPNFSQLPINRPRVPVNDNFRDGMHQTAVHEGIAPYLPSSLNNGAPEVADESAGGYIRSPRASGTEVTRSSGALEGMVSFGDHLSQASMYYRSLTQTEQEHTASAFAFELGKCETPRIRERTLRVLADIDSELCQAVAAQLGLPVPEGSPPTESFRAPSLSMIADEPSSLAGRRIAVLCSDTSQLRELVELRSHLHSTGVTLLLVAPHGGTLGDDVHEEAIHGSLDVVRSTSFDAVVAADGAGAMTEPKAIIFVKEAFRHFKPVLAWGDGRDLCSRADIAATDSGVSFADTVSAGLDDFTQALGMHRAWDRDL